MRSDVPSGKDTRFMTSIDPDRDPIETIRRLQIALQTSRIGVWEHRLEDDVLLWDEQMHEIYATGSTSRVADAALWLGMLHPDDREKAVGDFERARQQKGVYLSQFRIVLADGTVRHIRSRGHYHERTDGGASMIGAEWDVTADVLLNRELAYQRKIAEERAAALEASQALIEHAADHDYLTGLPNRRFLDKRIAALEASARVKQVAVLHIDLDRFKTINDTGGHSAGDLVLQVAARCIAAVAGPEDIVARVGGDEFVLVTPNFGLTSTLRARAEQIIAALQGGVPYRGQMLQTGASIGISWGRRGAIGTMMTEADVALYEAKTQGRGRACFFTQALRLRRSVSQELAAELQRGLTRNEIVPFYQIKVDAVTRRVAGLEALARWNHPARGILGPDVFLPVAEELMLVEKLDATILRAVLADRARWLEQGLVVPPIAVNVSPERLASVSLEAELRRLAIPQGAIQFELLETMFLDDCEEAVLGKIEAIKRMGIAIAIDDFGSGHASIIGLVKSKPDHLKIDRRLIQPLVDTPAQVHLIRSVIEIARSLGLGVTAEGVETEEHAAILAGLGCDLLQGYALGRPVPAEALVLAPAPTLRRASAS